jgi:hypothetical protein
MKLFRGCYVAQPGPACAAGEYIGGVESRMRPFFRQFAVTSDGLAS